MSAEKCPVCCGVGTLAPPPDPGKAAEFKTCHGCGGKGWVETNPYYWPAYVYRDPCDTCPHKKPYTFTWLGNSGGNY